MITPIFFPALQTVKKNLPEDSPILLVNSLIAVEYFLSRIQSKTEFSWCISISK
jgi:hypothetical protein